MVKSMVPMMYSIVTYSQISEIRIAVTKDKAAVIDQWSVSKLTCGHPTRLNVGSDQANHPSNVPTKFDYNPLRIVGVAVTKIYTKAF